MPRRIVITGMGTVTGFGMGVEIFWQNISRGQSAIRRFDLYPPESFSAQIAAQAPREFPSIEKTPLTRSAALALVAAQEAWDDASLKSTDTVALSSAIGWGSPTLDELSAIRDLCSAAKDETEIAQRIGEDYTHRVSTGYGQEILRNHFAIKGPLLSSLSACAASTQAIGEGAALIQSGEVDLVLAGGADTRLHPLGIIGYSLLGALTTKWNHAPEQASRPFDVEHSGFVIGEGAGFLILEELERALNRNATIYGEIISWAATTDAYRITDPEPTGLGASRCMTLALERAHVSPDKVGYINAHGTSTPTNDKAECHALLRTFGDAAKHIPISSTKSMIGHLSMGAGAVETIATVQALRHSILPPTINHHSPEAEFPFDFIPNQPRPIEITYALKNSFGFGGQNASLLLKKFV